MIGKTVNSILKAQTITNYVGDRIFPYVMSENTVLPALIYFIESPNPEYSKDGWVCDVIPFGVRAFANNYEQLQDLIVAIRDVVEMNNTGSGSQKISRIHVTGFDEGYAGGDIFYSELKFVTKVNKY
jgi:hypothetical protein